MDSLLEGRLRNTHLPFSKGMIPLYEAVVNSIHAIEDLLREKNLYCPTWQTLRQSELWVLRFAMMALDLPNTIGDHSNCWIANKKPIEDVGELGG
jgi:hypothetical protein